MCLLQLLSIPQSSCLWIPSTEIVERLGASVFPNRKFSALSDKRQTYFISTQLYPVAVA